MEVDTVIIIVLIIKHPHLGDGHHQPVFLLEVGEHLQEVEVGPALEEDDGKHDGDDVQNQE